MENLKELVRFNRYKSVESFNSATDVTSSTISIVKLDENIMDIYLGRTQLTHSNFPEVSIELRNLIDALGNRLDEIKTEFNSKLSSTSEKYDKKISDFIVEFEKGLIDLINYTNDLSKEILNAKSDSQKKYDDVNKKIEEINISTSNINEEILNQNKATNELSNKVAEIKSKQTSAINNIKKINQDIAALKSEDVHIFEVLSNIQNKLETINNNSVDSDVKKLKEDVESLFSGNNTLKSDVTKISKNISNINTALSKRLDITESDISIIKSNILELNDAIGDINNSNIDITPIISDINNIKQKINDVSIDLLKKIENNITEINRLRSKDNKFTNDINILERDVAALKTEDTHIFELINDLQSINSLIQKDNKKLNDEILSIKEKIEYLTGVNVDGFESLAGINRRLIELEKADESFQKTIDEINETIKDGVGAKLQWLIL